MKKSYNFINVLFIFIFVSYFSQAQTNSKYRRCYTTELYKKRLGKEGYRRFVQNTESWLHKSIQKQKTKRGTDDSVRIAVIVHLLHVGEATGEGANISAEQVESQIEVLNQDFKRLNPDTVNTPSIFRDVTACVNVHFELATIDANGNSLDEPGIDRVRLTKSTTYSIEEIDTLIKPSTIWDPEKYLNIWVISELEGGTLGYATYPENSTLSDITPDFLLPSNQEGVVVAAPFFGSNFTQLGSSFLLEAEFDRGRTTTHEIGHYLGLYHIWGDGDCTMDDFVDDTPLASDPNQDYNLCNDLSPNSCGAGEANDLPDMFQNFMDYSTDACFNLFTEGQKTRMRTVLENADRRKTLDRNFESVTGDGTVTDLPNFQDISNSVTVYPNPSSTLLTARIENNINGNYSIELINILGEVILEETIRKITNTYKYDLDISNLTKGLYILRLTNDNTFRATLNVIKN